MKALLTEEKRQKIEDALHSPLFMLLSVAIGFYGVFGGEGAIMPSLVMNGELFGLSLLFSRRFSAGLMPYFAVIAVGAQLVAQWTDILPYLPWGIPIALAMVYHFIRYPKRLSRGYSYNGIVLTSVAILLGGAFGTTAEELFNPAALYHYLALGILLLLLYLVYASDYKTQKPELAMEHFLWCMLFMGVICVAIAGKYACIWWEIRGNPDFYHGWFPSRNTVANLLLMAIPVPFYFAKKEGKAYSRIFSLLLGLVFYVAALFTTARTALLFGTVEVLLCLVWFYYGKKDLKIKLIGSLLALLLAVAAALVFGDMLADIFPHKFGSEGGFHFVRPGEARVELFWQSFVDLAKAPFFGVGIASMDDAFYKIPMACIRWYHLYFPQIWGSMGLFGCFAYLYHGYRRYRLATYRPTLQTVALTLSYIGLFFYSQTDPGEFIPLPFGHFAIIIFILLECRCEKDLSFSPLVQSPAFLLGYAKEKE